MFFLSKSYLQNSEYKVISDATLNIAPKTYKGYIDASHPRIRSKKQFLEQKFLKQQCKQIQFTTEDENEEK